MRIIIREKLLMDGRKSLYLDIYHRGKRNYEFLNLYLTKSREQNKEIKEIAEKVKSKREVELQNESFGFIPKSRKRTNFIGYFEKVTNEKTKNSVFHSTLKHIKEFSGNTITFEQIDEKWLNDLKKFLLEKVTQNSASVYFQKVKQVLKQAKMERIISINPGEFVHHIKMQDADRKFLDLNELTALAKTECKIPEVKRAFLFACFTGLRFSDINKLTWDEVKSDSLEFRQKKTKSVNYIPLSQTAKELLKKDDNIIPLNDNLVFHLPKKWWTNQTLKEWIKQAEVNKNLSFHVARHTFATLSLTFGADIYTVSKLLDHKNLKTTQVYAKIVDSKKQRAIDSLPNLQLSS